MRTRAFLAALPFIGLVAFAAPDARAQCSFDQSFPNANDVLRELQEPMALQFSIEIDLKDVRLVSEDHTEWPIDWVRVPTEVRKAEFRATKPLPPGNYSIEWNGYVRRHYHPDGGSIPFTLASTDAAAGAAASSAAAAMPASPAPRAAPGSPYRALLGAGAPRPGR
ncbi:copper resistance CopC family protein [Rhodoplanes roseus]|nr:copper resistance protein CopC [Rhodoplanes roseus]